ncbi:hypothetical protein, partial [Candidatus Hakubella thermalkaliphila]|uniref:hypothetical protein n=1 Tax=Candidatus Hakubella thermalkaliphila TaxID=2754717 RepID=UPI001C6167D4
RSTRRDELPEALSRSCEKESAFLIFNSARCLKLHLFPPEVNSLLVDNISFRLTEINASFLKILNKLEISIS